MRFTAYSPSINNYNSVVSENEVLLFGKNGTYIIRGVTAETIIKYIKCTVPSSQNKSSKEGEEVQLLLHPFILLKFCIHLYVH